MLQRLQSIERMVRWLYCKVKDTASGGIQSIVQGDNITVDNTDPLNPVVSSTGGGPEQESFNRIPSATYSELGITPESTIEEKQIAISNFLEGYDNAETDNLFFEIKDDALLTIFTKVSDIIHDSGYSTYNIAVPKGLIFNGFLKVSVEKSPDWVTWMDNYHEDGDAVRVSIDSTILNGNGGIIPINNLSGEKNSITMLLGDNYPEIIPDSLIEINDLEVDPEINAGKCTNFEYAVTLELLDENLKIIQAYTANFSTGAWCGGTNFYILSDSENGNFSYIADYDENNNPIYTNSGVIKQSIFGTAPNYLVLPRLYGVTRLTKNDVRIYVINPN